MILYSLEDDPDGLEAECLEEMQAATAMRSIDMYDEKQEMAHRRPYLLDTYGTEHLEALYGTSMPKKWRNWLDFEHEKGCPDRLGKRGHAYVFEEDDEDGGSDFDSEADHGTAVLMES